MDIIKVTKSKNNLIFQDYFWRNNTISLYSKLSIPEWCIAVKKMSIFIFNFHKNITSTCLQVASILLHVLFFKKNTIRKTWQKRIFQMETDISQKKRALL